MRRVPQCIIGVLILVVCLLRLAGGPAFALEMSAEARERLFKMTTETGVTPNQIPAINRPEFIRVVDAALNIEDDQPVFVAWLPGGPRIYPQSIMVWHEVVNEVINEERYCVTYSPLTGTLAAYKGKAGDFSSLFAADGRLLFNNAILFDRATNSLWAQLPGLCLEGVLGGKSLERLPAVWTTWGLAKKALPNARVLARPEIFKKSYGHDPYGSYMKTDTYYQNDRMVHRFEFKDKRLPMKRPVAGADLDGRQVAFDIEAMKDHPIMNFRLGARYLVALYDPALRVLRVFDRVHKGQAIDLGMRDGRLTDRTSGAILQPDGGILAENAADYAAKQRRGAVTAQDQLTEVPTVTTMWFAWLVFYPNTLLLPQDAQWAAEVPLNPAPEAEPLTPLP